MSILLRLGLSCKIIFRTTTRQYCITKTQHYPFSSTSSRVFSADTATKSKGTFDTKEEAIVLEKLRRTFDNEIATGGIVPFHKKALLYGNKIAVKDETGEYSYSQLYSGAKKLSIQISNLCGSGSNSKVAFLSTNTALYTLIQWACWFSGQIAVPLSPQHTQNMLEYFIKDSEASLLITVPQYEKNLAPLATSSDRPLIVVDHNFIPAIDSSSWLDPKNENVLQLNNQMVVEGSLNANFYANTNAMIMYTSGSTGHPKGTLISHKNLESQTNTLQTAWDINAKDTFLHVLPLNHVHGCVNLLACPLSAGAKVHMLPKFDSPTVWSTLLNVNMPSKDRISVFMAVPTIYSMLIAEYDKVFSKNERMVEYIRAQCEKKIRLMVAGSAPLVPSVFNKWFEITGHKLLERYGMTEIGMALSNPYMMDKVRIRTPGYVGQPLPGTEVKLVNNGQSVLEMKGEYGKGFWGTDSLPVYESSETKINPVISGELYVKGPSVFTEYLNKPDETKKSFEDGWFKTGDEAQFQNNMFKILGRSSVDIIKTGGYRVSALEIETHLMEHPLIADACVIGIPDIVWGQKIGALIVLKSADKTELPDFKEWCEKNIASYQTPTVLKIVSQMPRNALGKINKKTVLDEHFSEVIAE